MQHVTKQLYHQCTNSFEQDVCTEESNKLATDLQQALEGWAQTKRQDKLGIGKNRKALAQKEKTKEKEQSQTPAA